MIKCLRCGAEQSDYICQECRTAERQKIVDKAKFHAEVLDLLAEALVYVEESPTDGYKPGKGPQYLAVKIRAAIDKSAERVVPITEGGGE